jgi:hypothetical protein
VSSAILAAKVAAAVSAATVAIADLAVIAAHAVIIATSPKMGMVRR